MPLLMLAICMMILLVFTFGSYGIEAYVTEIVPLSSSDTVIGDSDILRESNSSDIIEFQDAVFLENIEVTYK